jgi:WXG100 family type VII secretion target
MHLARFWKKRKEFHMADKVGASSTAMSNAETDFKNRLLEFETATQNIRNAVNELASSWTGNGYQAFTSAMAKWDTDMKNVGQDLQHIADAVRQSDSAFQDLDASIAKAFSGF